MRNLVKLLDPINRLSEFQFRGLAVLMAGPRRSEDFAFAMQYRVSMEGSPWANPHLQGKIRLNQLVASKFASRDREGLWHITELGANRYINCVGEILWLITSLKNANIHRQSITNIVSASNGANPIRGWRRRPWVSHSRNKTRR